MSIKIMESPASNEQLERRELQTFLESGFLSKAPNLQHFLEFVADKYFAGRSDEVKEYSIAVQALNRPSHFDPQSDTIVRVTAHTLRKKLEQYYANAGQDHPVQMQLPAGRYVLRFVHKALPDLPADALEDLGTEDAGQVSDGEMVADFGTTTQPRSHVDWGPTPAIRDERRAFGGPDLAVAGEDDAGKAVTRETPADSATPALPIAPPGNSGVRRRSWVVAAIVTGVCLAAAGLPRLWVRHTADTTKSAETSRAAASGAPVGAVSGSTERLLFGDPGHALIDAAGQTWKPLQSCRGGTTFSNPDHEVKGTDDSPIFNQGRAGRFECVIPVAPGTYQLQLLFADTSNDKLAARQVVFSINNGPTLAVDVVDEAGGDDIATGKVYAGIHPASDGAIHLAFTSDGAFANAAELTPTASETPLPLRMLAGPAVLQETNGAVWLPERFFDGGRRTFNPDFHPRVENAKLFAWERFGHFRYSLPVAEGRDYTVKLFFGESWFGTSNGGPGGAGSRVFDVYCNGTTLLKDFDILKQQPSGIVVTTSRHVKPTAHGILELSFASSANYPLLNAIEVIPEDDRER